jgi:hypothetical protein
MRIIALFLMFIVVVKSPACTTINFKLGECAQSKIHSEDIVQITCLGPSYYCYKLLSNDKIYFARHTSFQSAYAKYECPHNPQ